MNQSYWWFKKDKNILLDDYDIPKIELIGKTDPYICIKLNDQKFYGKTKVIDY